MAPDHPHQPDRSVPRRSVRVRTTVAAVVVVAIATAAGAAVLLAVLRGLLADEIAAAAQTRAADIAATSTPGGPGVVLAVGDFEDDVAQLVGVDGLVLAASQNIAGQPAMAWPPPDDWVEVTNPTTREQLIVVQQKIGTGGAVLLVGRSVDSRDDAVGFVTRLLVAGLPVLLAIVAALTWLLVGRALRPVEAMRREVDEISSSALHRRVPQPAGRDEIARLARTMNCTLDRLERAQQQQRRFTSDASHELRSPVAAIRQYAEVALAHPERTTVADLAGTVLAEDLRVQQLVEDLLLLARVDEHSLHLPIAPLDLDDLVFAEARRLHSTIGLRVNTTKVSAARVDGNAGALRRVLRNIGDNAERHARSTIAFSLTESAIDACVVLIVDDDGPGIPEAERERVLERFVRLEDARDRDSGGSGLGLAIVAEVVAAHGGALQVADSPAGGARLRLTFPAAAPDDGAVPGSVQRSMSH